jgi:hypothetical protein
MHEKLRPIKTTQKQPCLAEKRGVRAKKNDVCSRVFALLRGLWTRKPFILRNLQASEPLQKNHA